MSNDDIKDLIQIFVDSGVAEMEIKRGENSLRLRRSFGPSATTEVVIPHHMVTQSAPAASSTLMDCRLSASGA